MAHVKVTRKQGVRELGVGEGTWQKERRNKVQLASVFKQNRDA